MKGARASIAVAVLLTSAGCSSRHLAGELSAFGSASTLTACTQPAVGQPVALLAGRGQVATDAVWIGDRWAVAWRDVALSDARSGVTTFDVGGRELATRVLSARTRGDPAATSIASEAVVSWFDTAELPSGMPYAVVTPDLQPQVNGQYIMGAGGASGGDPPTVAQLGWTGSSIGALVGWQPTHVTFWQRSGGGWGTALGVLFGGTQVTQLPGRSVIATPGALTFVVRKPCGGAACLERMTVYDTLPDGHSEPVSNGEPLPFDATAIALAHDPTDNSLLIASVEDGVRLRERDLSEVLAPAGAFDATIDIAAIGVAGQARPTTFVAWSRSDQAAIGYDVRGGGQAAGAIAFPSLPGARRVRVVAADDSVGVFVFAGGAPDAAPVSAYVRIRCADAPADPVPGAELQVPGTACGSASQCASGFCADGVCCDTACTGACTTCSAPYARGRCGGVYGSDDPDTCAGAQTCDANATCAARP